MWLWFIVAGLFGGLCGGMGMGGGTLLIPILTIIFGIAQHSAQGINLIVFIPTAIIALIIHLLHKLLDFKMFLIIIVPAITSAVLTAFLAGMIDKNILKICFAIFLLGVGIFELIVAIKRSCVKTKLNKFYTIKAKEHNQQEKNEIKYKMYKITHKK